MMRFSWLEMKGIRKRVKAPLFLECGDIKMILTLGMASKVRGNSLSVVRLR